MLVTSPRNFSIFIALFTITYSQQDIGDICHIGEKQGICKLYGECQIARDDLTKRGIWPITCGFKLEEPIVCCMETEKRKPGVVSKKQCEENAKYVYEVMRSPIALINASVLTIYRCGHNVEKLIIGGEKANRMEFPHMAAIGFEEPSGERNWNCGGTILSSRYILTAAHCLSHHIHGNAKLVRVGVARLNDPDHSQTLEIEELIKHPRYRYPSHYNDIGLIKLKKAIKLNPYARPACLYTKSKVSAERAIATGWGDTTISGQSKSNHLMKVKLNLVGYKECSFVYRDRWTRKFKKGILDKIQICAGGGDNYKQPKDTCMGDSGGPLQIYHRGDKIKCMYDIIGVTSFGEPCTGLTGVYVRVSNFIQWIEDIVWPEN